MSKLTGNHPAAGAVVKALGLPPDAVRSLTLRMAVNDVVTVAVEYLPDEDQIEAVAAVFADYDVYLVRSDQEGEA